MNDSYTERIIVKSLLPPSECYDEIIKVDLLSFIEDNIIQQNPAKYDFTIFKGTTFNIKFVYKDKKSKLPYDLSGFTVSGTAFMINNNDIVFDLHPIIEDAKNGKISITLTPEETSKIEISECGTYYHYYLNLISNNDYVYRILIGNIRICQ